MWLFDLIWSWFGLSTLVGAGALIIAILLPAPLVALVPGLRQIALSIAIYAFCFSFVFGLGFNEAHQNCNEGALKSQIETLKRDIEAAKQQSQRNERHGQEIKSAADGNKKQVDQINVVLMARPKEQRCSLSADDAHRLRNIK